MTSSIAWLDQSVEEHRRVRELVKLFSLTDSRDELGLGPVRDVFSEQLFPGVSVIQTRARYFLFVPWLFREGQRRAEGATLLRRVQAHERRLVESLRAAGAEEGLIGRRAGPQVKILPSNIYWYGLGRWRILTSDISPDQLSRAGGQGDEADERVARPLGEWHPTLPAPPPGFPDEVPGGFALTMEEGVWLKERIVEAAPGSLIAHLVLAPAAPDPDAPAPWDDTATTDVLEPLATWVADARLFSVVLHGAALLYNLLLAEAYEREGFDRIDAPVDRYRTALGGWADAIAAEGGTLRAWDRAGLRARVVAQNPRIGLRTWDFVDRWVDDVLASDGAVAASPGSRQLVAERERTQKRRQSRLVDRRLLATWSGAAGARPMTYRWETARTIVTDIFASGRS